MPRQREYNQSEVLEAAIRAFWAKGYANTSMDDLVRATGLNRGSLYAAFEGKRALFLTSLKDYDRRYRVEFLNNLNREHDPVEAILALFEETARMRSRDGKPGGCLLVNTALEVSPHDPEIRDFVQASFNGVEAFFCKNIQSAKKENTLPKHIDDGDAARSLLALFLGLRVLTRSGAPENTVNHVVSQARQLLER